MLEIAVFGAGHWGPNLIRCFDGQRRSRVRWIVDPVPQRLEAASLRFPHAKVASDPEPVFADPNVHAVVVATPTVHHEALVRRALESDLHVFVEKPLTSDSRSSRELCELAAQRNRVLLVGHIFLFNPAVEWVHEALGRGDLGRVYYLASNRTNLGPIRADVNAAWDLAAQDIAIFNFWLDALPVGVSAHGHAWINPGLHDAVFATLRYPNDVLANVHVSWLNPSKVRQITLVASKKMLGLDDLHATEPIRLYDKTVTDAQDPRAFVDTFAGFRSVVHTGNITIPPVRTGEPLVLECAHFLDCIENGTTPRSGGPEGLAVVRVLEAMDRSMADGGREVKL
jgi:predicted dehydrogenase